jgi:hypothetical protein
MARWLPTGALVLAFIALGVAVFRQPDAPPIDSADLAAIEENVQLVNGAVDALSERVDILERAATAGIPGATAELEAVQDAVENLSAGLENACDAIATLSNRIDDVASRTDGSSIPLPPSLGGSC